MAQPAMRVSQERMMIPLDSLKVPFFVRKELNEDRVFALAELYDAGVVIDPLVITRNFEIVSGRHRRAALEFLGKKEANCVFTETSDPIRLIVEAFVDNMGGALPPTRADQIAVMRQLIEKGATQRQIVELFKEQLPPSIVRENLKQAYAEISVSKLRSAVNAVTEKGRTIAQAAEEFDVELERLKEEIQGKRRKQRACSVGVPAIKNSLSQRHKGNSLRTWDQLKKLFAAFEDGETKEDQVRLVLKHIDHLLKQNQRTHRQWGERFEALVATKKANVKKG